LNSSKDKNLKMLESFQIPFGFYNEKDTLSDNEIIARSALSQYVTKDNRFFEGNWITTNELSMIAGLPQKEVVGLGLKEEVEFGLNFKNQMIEEDKINLGKLVQSGNIIDKIDVCIDRKNLDKHLFVTGVTGSGKTTTCQKILIDSNLPFLIIEPAKTEYRILTKRFDDLMVFTLGKDFVTPFRLNPFEFFEHESITSRVDMIKASLKRLLTWKLQYHRYRKCHL
jgi:predicted NACHT family NTPase